MALLCMAKSASLWLKVACNQSSKDQFSIKLLRSTICLSQYRCKVCAYGKLPCEPYSCQAHFCCQDESLPPNFKTLPACVATAIALQSKQSLHTACKASVPSSSVPPPCSFALIVSWRSLHMAWIRPGSPSALQGDGSIRGI